MWPNLTPLKRDGPKINLQNVFQNHFSKLLCLPIFYNSDFLPITKNIMLTFFWKTFCRDNFYQKYDLRAADRGASARALANSKSTYFRPLIFFRVLLTSK